MSCGVLRGKAQAEAKDTTRHYSHHDYDLNIQMPVGWLAGQPASVLKLLNVLNVFKCFEYLNAWGPDHLNIQNI